LLEIVAMFGPELFLSADPEDAGTRITLERAVETLLSIFDRTLLFPEKQSFALILQRQRLEREITQTTMAHPTLGVLLCLFNSAPLGPELLPRALAEQGALTDAVMDFWLHPWEQQMADGPTSPQTRPWLDSLPEFVAAVARAKEERVAQEKKGLKRVDSLEVCPICYADAMDTRFQPCGHTSCADCITRHLLNSKRCFFCNAEIESTGKLMAEH
jgi:Kip1 ubiquitination-promoting complex protein 1